MIKHGTLALIATLLIPATAFAQVSVGSNLGTSETAIRAALQAQGYSVSEVDIETGEIEVDVEIDGQMYDVEISPETGLVLAVREETEDSAGGDDDTDDEDDDQDEMDDDDDENEGDDDEEDDGDEDDD